MVTAIKKVVNGANKDGRLLVTFDGGLYDVTEFIADHPGGAEIIQEYAGQDITHIFDNPASHKHSQFAHNLLKKYCIDDVKEEEGKDGKKKGQGKTFLDLDKPLIPQMWRLRVSKEEYLRQVHKPRHLNRDARFFESDYLERLTKTPWWFIPLFWVPILLTSGYMGASRLAAQGLGTLSMAILWVFGTFMWTILEYVFHRFLFHMTDMLPNHPVAFTVHFLFHGVHHFLPMDQYRLVMPPVMFGFFCSVVIPIFLLVIPPAHMMMIYSGTLVGYITYDMMHYFFHHGGAPPIKHVAVMKKYHIDHHYVDENLGFGVSSKIWDQVFHTELPAHAA